MFGWKGVRKSGEEKTVRNEETEPLLLQDVHITVNNRNTANANHSMFTHGFVLSNTEIYLDSQSFGRLFCLNKTVQKALKKHAKNYNLILENVREIEKCEKAINSAVSYNTIYKTIADITSFLPVPIFSGGLAKGVYDFFFFDTSSISGNDLIMVEAKNIIFTCAMAISLMCYFTSPMSMYVYDKVFNFFDVLKKPLGKALSTKDIEDIIKIQKKLNSSETNREHRINVGLAENAENAEAKEQVAMAVEAVLMQLAHLKALEKGKLKHGHRVKSPEFKQRAESSSNDEDGNSEAQALGPADSSLLSLSAATPSTRRAL